MIDLENQHRESLGEAPGERPLVDLDAGPDKPLIDSGPRPLVDSGPRPFEPAQPPAIPRASASLRAEAPPSDPRNLLATAPRQMPGAAAPSAPLAARPLAPAQVPHFQAPAESTDLGSRRRSVIRPWMIFVAILLAAAAAGVIVAMSGPDVAVHHAK
jgi:hypothetical protein